METIKNLSNQVKVGIGIAVVVIFSAILWMNSSAKLSGTFIATDDNELGASLVLTFDGEKVSGSVEMSGVDSVDINGNVDTKEKTVTMLMKTPSTLFSNSRTLTYKFKYQLKGKELQLTELSDDGDEIPGTAFTLTKK